MLLEISVLIIAVASVVITTAILIGLRLLVLRMQALSKQTSALQHDFQELSVSCQRLIEAAQGTVQEVGEVASTVNGVMGAAKDMGQSIGQTATVMKQISNTLSQRAAQFVEKDRDKGQLEEVLQWSELAISAWQLWQAGREKQNQKRSE